MAPTGAASVPHGGRSEKGIDDSSRNVCGEVTKGSPLWKIISQSTRPSLRGSATNFQTTYWKLPRLRELTEETTSQCIFVRHYIFAPALNHRLASESRAKFKVSNRKVQPSRLHLFRARRAVQYWQPEDCRKPVGLLSEMGCGSHRGVKLTRWERHHRKKPLRRRGAKKREPHAVLWHRICARTFNRTDADNPFAAASGFLHSRPLRRRLISGP
jgi:hypothetical protein